MESPGSGNNLSALAVNNTVERKSIKFTTSYREIVVLFSSQRGRNRDLPNNVRLFNFYGVKEACKFFGHFYWLFLEGKVMVQKNRHPTISA